MTGVQTCALPISYGAKHGSHGVHMEVSTSKHGVHTWTEAPVSTVYMEVSTSKHGVHT